MKLVRDGIPDIIRQDSVIPPKTRLATRHERLFLLKRKLVEEANELLVATGDDLVEEAADVAEVLGAALDIIGHKRVEAKRLQKHEERGGFDAGVVLLEWDDDIESDCW